MEFIELCKKKKTVSAFRNGNCELNFERTIIQ